VTMSKEALLGASDLIEREVDLPSIGGTVRVRSLPAAYANQATSEARERRTDARGRQTARVNTAKLEALQVLHGLVEPKLASLEEAEAFALKNARAWRAVVQAIDEISGIDKETIERTNATFQAGGASPGRDDVGVETSAGNGGPDLRVRTGA
jgi:hypothetical protein